MEIFPSLFCLKDNYVSVLAFTNFFQKTLKRYRPNISSTSISALKKRKGFRITPRNSETN